MAELTHLDASGTARMGDVGDKPETRREAVATARVSMEPETMRLLQAGAHAKGDVLTVARIAGIQAANRDAWPKYREAGTEVTRLSEEDVVRFREVAIPKWFEWANKDSGAARLFQIHLDVMQDPEVALVDPSQIEGYSLDL